jgi:site-specific recombinase
MLPADPTSAILSAFTDPQDAGGGIAELDGIVTRLEHAADRHSALDGIVELATWMRRLDPQLSWPTGEPDPSRGQPAARALGVLAMVLERSPRAQAAVAGAIERVAAETDGLALFAEVGVPSDRGLFDEMSDRFARKALPRPRDEQDLAELVLRAFPDEDAAVWLESIDLEIAERFVHALQLAPKSLARWRDACDDALLLLGTRVAALGSGEALRVRRSELGVRSSPYLALPRAVDALLAAWRSGDDDREALAGFRTAVDGARAGCDEVLNALERRGVSIDLVYAIDAIEKLLQRAEALVEAVRPPASEKGKLRASHALLSELVRARLSDTSFVALVRDNGRLLARKIVERAGRTGEHYIASTPREHLAMWGSALVGGIVTTATAALKIVIAGARLPLFVEGVFASTNYALSFVLIQVAHGTLATKQPAMTAATLAGILARSSGEARSEELATHLVKIVRSQLAAALGNIVAVSVGAALFDLAWRAAHGQPFLGPDEAAYVLHSLDPFTTGTLLYAAITGVLLWLASLSSGAIGNWSAYHRLPLAIAEHRLGSVLGAPRMLSLSRAFASNVSSIGGSIVLGVLLGMTPIVGKFFGLPIDVRHVTLSTGQMALALAADLPTALEHSGALRAAAGIAAIFVLNLGVSFTLALAVATRARSVRLREIPGLARAFAGHVARRPMELVWPPRASMP